MSPPSGAFQPNGGEEVEGFSVFSKRMGKVRRSYPVKRLVSRSLLQRTRGKNWWNLPSNTLYFGTTTWIVTPPNSWLPV
jgi:hypothetical protein